MTTIDRRLTINFGATEAEDEALVAFVVAGVEALVLQAQAAFGTETADAALTSLDAEALPHVDPTLFLFDQAGFVCGQKRGTEPIGEPVEPTIEVEVADVVGGGDGA